MSQLQLSRLLLHVVVTQLLEKGGLAVTQGTYSFDHLDTFSQILVAADHFNHPLATSTIFCNANHLTFCSCAKPLMSLHLHTKRSLTKNRKTHNKAPILEIHCIVHTVTKDFLVWNLLMLHFVPAVFCTIEKGRKWDCIGLNDQDTCSEEVTALPSTNDACKTRMLQGIHTFIVCSSNLHPRLYWEDHRFFPP